MPLFSIFAPTSTSATSQTLQNTATPQPAESISASMTDESFEGDDIERASSSPLSSLPSPKAAQPLKDAAKKRGRPKKIRSSPQLPPLKNSAIAVRGRGRPKKVASSPQKPAAMAQHEERRHVSTKGADAEGSPSAPFQHPFDSNDDDDGEEDDDENDGERALDLLQQAAAAVKDSPMEAIVVKSKRGRPRGAASSKKNLNTTPTSKTTRPPRGAAAESAKRTSASYALTSDPVADDSGVETRVTPVKIAVRGAKQANPDDEAEDAAPPAAKRGRPPKNHVDEQPKAGRARVVQDTYEPITVGADEISFTEDFEQPPPKRKRGRPSKDDGATGPSKARGGRPKQTAVDTNVMSSLSPDQLVLRGFSFGMKKVTTGGVEKSVFEGEFTFRPHGDEEESTATHQIETLEGGGFTMRLHGELS
ncbi:hypothetical protein FKW77_003147 [Venturia effusa]|uniref:Uncharacterized protein n=1 Tax=Venturia effusa TaxID=50376 RepID=A0A517LL35_9PEZI|nr:hypothetical protein FKW77_003147 [Venturia effusa]